MKKSIVIAMILAIGLSAGFTKADINWTRKAEMPIPRYCHSTNIVGGKIYAVGGWAPQLGNLTRVDEYDPLTDTWTRKADMPTPRGCTSATVVNDKIYVIGGDANEDPIISIVEVYDPSTDTWAEQTELPSQRYWFSTCAVNGIIHVIGGNNGSRAGNTRTHLNTVEAYDPKTDTWTTKADMHTKRSFLSTCVVDGLIYAIGGGAPGRSTVEVYDPATDTWTTKAPMPTARYGLDTVVVDGKICAIGGWYFSTGGPIYSTVEVYDLATDTWTKGVDIPVTAAGLSASEVNGKIYVMGGATLPHDNLWILTSAVYASEPFVDFNGDEIVDSADLCIMVDHWGEDYSFCDIFPMPWGDGIVDVEDLKVLAEHLFEEIFPDELIAYWKLDEMEGDIAYNNISSNHGVLSGNPTWQPDSGQVAGALQFDGIDDYISTNFILDPSLGAFSAFAWIKGGAPGQVILSQTDGPGGAGEIWLGADAVEGKLMTGIRPPSGRSPTPPMVADNVITDGQWHHIGIVVTEQKVRLLYVDGLRVAFDTQPVVLPPSDGGLYIGTSKNLDTGSFFLGLIDDVRIYNRAVTP
jgi:N-acetylneuraminic acid mutarotase